MKKWSTEQDFSGSTDRRQATNQGINGSTSSHAPLQTGWEGLCLILLLKGYISAYCILPAVK